MTDYYPAGVDPTDYIEADSFAALTMELETFWYWDGMPNGVDLEYHQP